MLWWYWMVLGLILMGLELATPGGFYLLFFGLSALVVGALGGFDLSGPDWMQWLLFSALAVVSLLFFRGPLLRAMKRADYPGEVDSLVGEQATVLISIAAGAMGKVELHGSTWNACNTGPGALIKDQRCRVERVDGLTLWVTAA